MIKGPIHREDVTITYVLNIRAPKHIKQILTDLKGVIENNTLMVGDFNNPLSTMNKSYRQKINMKTLDSNYTLEQMKLIDTYRMFHPTATQYVFF